MNDLWNLNTNVIIAFALTSGVALLVYIAFFKESVEKARFSRRSR